MSSLAGVEIRTDSSQLRNLGINDVTKVSLPMTRDHGENIREVLRIRSYGNLEILLQRQKLDQIPTRSNMRWAERWALLVDNQCQYYLMVGLNIDIWLLWFPLSSLPDTSMHRVKSWLLCFPVCFGTNKHLTSFCFLSEWLISASSEAGLTNMPNKQMKVKGSGKASVISFLAILFCQFLG